tara:strand:- start:115 stop:246 length:132 start_codon:yes stop_codon:yes gene_type:complete
MSKIKEWWKDLIDADKDWTTGLKNPLAWIIALVVAVMYYTFFG